MQLITVLSVAASMATTAAAVRSAVTLDKECDTSKPLARVHNRCSYDVYLWSVYKGDGCPTDQMVTLKTGETYQENYADADGGDTGISIKISKTQECKGSDITQLEYFIQTNSPGFNYNYLDVSYVDCAANDATCPTRQEGYYLVVGNQTGAVKASAANTWCPVMSCTDPSSCNKISYVLPDDVQTKTCEPNQNTDFYMCGGDAPGEESSSSSSAPESSAAASTMASSKAPATSAAPSSTADSYESDFTVAAAAVTPAPQAESVNNQKTKTEVVYVTAYETINAKRHAHGHARRHQPFHA